MTTDCTHFRERIGELLAGGLSAADRESLEAHLAACPHCAKAYRDLQTLESDMTALFAASQPDAMFESRLLNGLRNRGGRRIHPLVTKIAVGVAASILLGGFGYVADMTINHRVGWMSAPVRVRDASNLRQIGQALLQSGNDSKPSVQHQQNIETDKLVEGAKQIAASKTLEDRPATSSPPRELVEGRSNANNHDEMIQGGSRGDFQTNSFFGVQRDNIHASRKGVNKLPYDGNDSILLPTDDTSGEAIAGTRITPTQTGGTPLGITLGDRFAPPQSGAERWNSGGGANTALNWNNLSGKAVERFLPGSLNPRSIAKNNLLPASEAEASKADDRKPTEKPKDAPPAQEPVKPEAAQLDQNAAPPTTQPGANGNQVEAPAIQTKIIRNGDVEFEVDSFDTAAVTVSKIVTEEGGYIGTTSSEKLPNGKVKGVLIVRVPPGRLDTLVLKLRGLGDLKRQNLAANDVTKQYYDLASELRAAHAMQDRLMEIIKTGNAQVKDLLNVEKELATWRGKIEKLEGEIRYYDNLVSLSTLNISLMERDIRTASAIKEIETADAGIEVDDVEAARAAAIKSIEDAKGRIIEAELKKLDAGQFAAKVVADVPAESAGSVIDRLRQIGKVARLEISRKQTTPDNSTPLAGTKIERGDTHIVASFYNLANVAPRQTVTLQMAADDVAKTYAAILSQIEKAGGRVVTSSLQQPRPDETSGAIAFELPANVADQNLQQLQQSGLILQMTVSENPDTANVTSAKRGFNLSLLGSRAIPPRQTLNVTAEATDVAQVSAALSTFAQSIGGRMVDTNQSTSTNSGSNAMLKIELPVSKLPELLGRIESATKVRTQQSSVRSDVPDSPGARAQVELRMTSPDTLVTADSGFMASLRRGLSTSVAGLLWSLQLIIIGLCLVVPWVVLIWASLKLWNRRKATPLRSLPKEA